MMSMIQGLSPKLYSPRIYIYSKSDVLSCTKAIQFEESRNGSSDSRCLSISRSRNVGQGWVSSVFTTALSIVHALYIFLQVWPDVVRSNTVQNFEFK